MAPPEITRAFLVSLYIRIARNLNVSGAVFWDTYTCISVHSAGVREIKSGPLYMCRIIS
jgi:hypothetical protein